MRLFQSIIPASVLMALLTACGGGESNVESGNRDGFLHYGNGAEPQGLDPHVVTGVPENHIIRALFEGLAVKNPITLEPEPGVAERWDISDDERSPPCWTRAGAHQDFDSYRNNRAPKALHHRLAAAAGLLRTVACEARPAAQRNGFGAPLVTSSWADEPDHWHVREKTPPLPSVKMSWTQSRSHVSLMIL